MEHAVNGNIQYPRTQTLWKKESFPPSNFVLIVIMALPNHIIIKTPPNTIPD
jgi:hypothetical protein